MDILIKLLLVVAILGAAQWMHAHPDATVTQDVVHFWAQVRVQWLDFVDHVGEYIGKFPVYMRELLDTTPKPKLPA